MAKPKTIVNTTVTTNNILNDDGVIINQTTEETKSITTQAVPESEPDFIKIYLNRIASIQGLNASQSKVLFEIVQYMPYANAGQLIILNSFVKEQIARKLNTSIQYISNVLTELVKKNLLFKCISEKNKKARTGAYSINQLYIARGNWSDIKKLQLQVSFDKNGEIIDSVTLLKDDGTTQLIKATKTLQQIPIIKE